MLDLAAWELLAVPVTGELRDASREDATAAYRALIDARAARVAALVALAGHHGAALEGDDAAERLGAWLVAAAAEVGPDAIGSPEWSGPRST